KSFLQPDRTDVGIASPGASQSNRVGRLAIHLEAPVAPDIILFHVRHDAHHSTGIAVVNHPGGRKALAPVPVSLLVPICSQALPFGHGGAAREGECRHNSYAEQEQRKWICYQVCEQKHGKHGIAETISTYGTRYRPDGHPSIERGADQSTSRRCSTTAAELRGTTRLPRASRCTRVKAAPNNRISEE